MKGKSSQTAPQRSSSGGSGLLSSMLSASSTTATASRTAAAPRSGPAWFGGGGGGGNTTAAAGAEATSRRTGGGGKKSAGARGGGMLRSPAELGRAERDEVRTGGGGETAEEAAANTTTATTTMDPSWPQVQAGPVIMGMRQRKQNLHQRLQMASAETAWMDLAAAASASSSSSATSGGPSHVTALTYEGLEVWIASHHDTAVVCLARTQCVLQTLTVNNDSTTTRRPEDDDGNNVITGLTAHPATGQLAVSTAAGVVHTFRPRPVPAALASHGRVRWHAGPVVSVAALLSSSDDDHDDHNNHNHHHHNKNNNDTTTSVVSLSAEYKLLVAAGDQLAVWDVCGNHHQRSNGADDGRDSHGDDHSPSSPPPPPEAPVLWMTRLPAPVHAAAISGDGEALAVVLQQQQQQQPQRRASGNVKYDQDDDEEADGVHTFERDTEDGADDELQLAATAASEGQGRGNVGIMYKPGPFLVHNAPVTRLEFRGLGFCHSSFRGDTDGIDGNNHLGQDIMANDLLLTTAADGTARIFGQDGWKPLTEWVCGAQTRVDWIRGQAAFSLGDLEAAAKQSSRSGGGGMRRNASSSEDLPSGAAGGGGDRTTAIPAHTTPLSQAGAWISEISWDNDENDGEDEDALPNPEDSPWISLSRLTYLKRGTGDLTPTLLESVSTVLPPVSIIKTAVQATSDALTVEGLWPAWNPFVDVPTDQVGNGGNGPAETLRGSAMAFLGLAQTDGYFGDALMQGTQCPPTELRLTAAHPVTGHVMILEFHLHGQDKNLTALELGTPIQSLVNLPALLQEPVATCTEAVTNHGQGLLWASSSDGQRIQMHWRQPAIPSLVPAQWLPTDIAKSPEAVASILRGTTKFRDESLLPVPLALRPLSAATADDPVQLLQWWPERPEIVALHGPRLLITWKRSGAAAVWQVLPPLAERTIPEDGCGTPSYQKSSEAHYLLQRQNSSRIRRKNTSSDHDAKQAEEYEVSITPDSQYGLGLRLESLDDGEPAIAGSFKKNPTTGEDLPAERTGMINLGDELVSANGVNLEDKAFDDIINTVREFGASASAGNPIRMRFRRKERRERGSSASSTETGASKRRTKEQMFGVKPGAVVDYKSSGTVSSLGSSIHADASATQSVPEPSLLARLAPVSGLPKVLSEKHAEKRVLMILDPSAPRKSHEPPPALLVHATEQGLSLHRLRIPVKDSDQVECTALKTFDLPCIKALELVKTSSEQIFLVAASVGHLQTIVITLPKSTETAQLSTFDISRKGPTDPETALVRTHSLHFLATSDLMDGKYREIAIWTPQLHPGCGLSADTADKNEMEEYYQTVIHLDANMGTDAYFVDFCFIQSGFLDSSPMLLTFSEQGVWAYQRREGSFDWVLVVNIQYGYNLQPLVSSHRPMDCLPHLHSAVRACFTSHDEDKFLRSDWHPDSLLTQACTDEKGVQHALNWRIRSFMVWLASEGKELLQDFQHLPLLCSDHKPDENHASAQNVQQSTNSYHGPSSPTPSSFSDAHNDKTWILTTLRDMLTQRLAASGTDPEPGRSCLDFMNPVDVKILLAIVELLLNPPTFKGVDSCGELFIFAFSILNQVVGVEEAKEEKQVYTFHVPGVLQRQGSSFSNSRNTTSKGTVFVASAACVSGLVSASQDMIVEAVKADGVKLDWAMARRLRIPLWVRSDASLARLAEEIGQTIFREKRDIMECAIFFIIARKTKKLRNLAATDRSESGIKFFKFLTSHDFASERGRRAAEKNAFSLLRKCRYQASAAFFLLAKPPALLSALETIVTKMQDSDLAFMVARLMESKEVVSDSRADGLSGGALAGLGGGGGYAGTGTVEPPLPTVSATEKFEKWNPSCGKATKKLLVERLIPLATSDPPLASLFLVWMNKREEASWWLPGFLESSPSDKSDYRVVHDAKGRLFDKLKGTPQTLSSSQNVSFALDKVNALIDFASSPILLKAMKSCPRARCASALLVSEAMVARGIETVSLWNHLQISPDEDTKTTETKKSMSEPSSATMHPTSSIFDDFNPAPVARKVEHKPESSVFDNFDPPPSAAQNHQSSIFDDLEPPPQMSTKTPSGNPQSSIFDSFDYQSPPKAAPAAAASTPQSSIFDTFDVPARPTAKTPSDPSGTMQSSIFDSFDAPVTKPKAPASSSIFDAYDVPSSASASQKNASSTGQTPSSTFDVYTTGISTSSNGKPQKDGSEEENKVPKQEIPESEVTLCLSRSPLPEAWSFLGDEVILETASRRLCRVVASTLASFHGDPVHPPIDDFFQNLESYIPSGAADVVQLSSDVSGILSPIQEALDDLSTSSGLGRDVIADAALRLLATFESHHRSLFGSIILIALERNEAVEAIVRTASESVLRGASYFAVALDGCAFRRKTRATVSSLHTRREAVRTCWQLESCLWLHRGGGLPMSGLALKEAILAVRMGLTLGSWNRHHETLEAILRCEPDCLLDDDAGRYLWSSLKDPTPLDIVEEQPKKTTSGGWEFLVDCRRSEATEMLRESPTGSFIIRPHPSDHGVFTLSFKTNLMSSDSNHDKSNSEEEKREEELGPAEDRSTGKEKTKGVRKDDVVQHAIVRLSDSGFRCGSFGPFSSLIELLETVSSSLPFQLRFDLPPQNRIIQEEGSQPSPNALLFRKLALSRADSLVSNPFIADAEERDPGTCISDRNGEAPRASQISGEREQSYSGFLELLVLSRLRRQLCSIASAKYSDEPGGIRDKPKSMDRSASEGTALLSMQQSQHNAAYWILQPLLSWCRCMEVRATIELAPETVPVRPETSRPLTDFSEKSIEMTLSSDNGGKFESCDSVLRRLIQRESGIEFSTLRLVDGGDCSMVVLFSKVEAIKWLVSTGTEESETAAEERLTWMENERVIEAVDLSQLPLKQRPADMDEGLRYRIVDPWEVEAVHDREGETRSAVLGRQQYHAFSLGKIALACENDFRTLGGLSLLELWTSSKGGVIMSRSLACVHPPWERAAGGDLQVSMGQVREPEPFDNAIRQHLYRNSLFRRLGLPQRFMALMQVELLDLKNLTSPTGSLSLSVYGLLRLKRKGSSGVLSNKTRTLDTAQTLPVRLGKPTGVGPNAPATWGSVVRFRFPLPEGVNVDGSSLDADRESLFRGPPSVLQISVYEKKLLVDTALGTADISTDGLWAGGQLEEWVPLRSEKHGGIHWFARIRLTLRFELMCKLTADSDGTEVPPSVGLQRMAALTKNGGAAHEDHKRSMSSPDLLGYLESMVY